MKHDPRTFASCHVYARPLVEEGPALPRLHFKLVRKAFHKFGKHAPGILRLYIWAWLSFPGRDAFHADELLEVMGQFGYGTSREARADLLRKLRGCPDWFTERSPLYFSFKSRRKIIGMQSDRFITFNPSILRKENSKAWTDLLIALQASGQQTAAQNISNQTGYGRARVFDALKKYKDKRVKIYSPLPGLHRTQADALREASAYWSREMIADVIQEGDFYRVMLIIGLSFHDLRDSTSDGAGRIKAPGILSRVEPARIGRETTVFTITGHRSGVNAVTGLPVSYAIAGFVSLDAANGFIKRHEKTAQRCAA